MTIFPLRSSNPRSILIAKSNFADESPIGRRIVLGRPGFPWFGEIEIVGVAKDVRSSGLKGDLRQTGIRFLPPRGFSICRPHDIRAADGR